MSDPAQPPPPKPKPGSLRDRIAAFEKKPSPSSTPGGPPPVRPKPGNVSWKPSPPSPPAPPTPENEDRERQRGGMSASDAKESIGKGGSLKERMAALQGRGAFGGAGPPNAPPPVGPKPARRPPLVVSPPADEDEEEKTLEKPKSNEEQESENKENKEASVDMPGGNDAAPKEDEEAADEDQDEEAKERERRAAIAARMARLGGARVGMGPPVFGKKPEVRAKPKEIPEQKEEPKATSQVAEGQPIRDDSEATPATSVESSITPAEETAASSEQKESTPEVSRIATDEVTPKETTIQALSPTTSTSESRPALDTTSSQSSSSTSRSPPTSMPMPAAPRRAGPPRSRSARNIKAQAAKQEQEASEAPPVPSEPHTEANAAPIVPSGLEAEATKKEHPEPEPEPEPEPISEHTVHEPSDVAPPIAEPAVIAPQDLEDHATPPSPTQAAQEDEAVQDVPKSPEKAAHEQSSEAVLDTPAAQQPPAEEIPDVPAVSLADPVSPPKTPSEATSPPEDFVPEHAESTAEPKQPEDSTISPANEKTHTHDQHGSEASLSIERPAEAYSPTAEQDVGDPAVTDIPEPSADAKPSLSAAEPPEAKSPESESDPSAIATQEAEQPKTAEDETEDDEAARRKRITERMAKMGARNPFSANPFGAAPPPRRVSGDATQTQETPSAPPLKGHSTAEETINHGDVGPEREDIAVVSESHEAADPEPRVSGVAQMHDGVPTIMGALEEHEATDLEHKATFSSGPEELPEVSLPPEQSSPTEETEMAPPRITRAVPPAPRASVEEPAVSPIEHASQRRPISPLSQEPASPIKPNDTEHRDEDALEEHTNADGADALPSDRDLPSMPTSEPLREVGDLSPQSSPTSTRPIPPRAEYVISPSTESVRTQSPTAESPHRTIPPPARAASIPHREEQPEVRSPISPTSSRRAVSPPARALPVSPLPRSTSPELSVAFPAASTRRSIPPPPRSRPSLPADQPISPPAAYASSPAEDAPPAALSEHSIQAAPPPPRRSPSQSTEAVVSSPPRRASSQNTEDIETTAASRDFIGEQEVLTDSEADPIDPSFYSPPRSPLQTPREQQSFASHSTATSGDAVEEDAEQGRRRTIAERMAKLGGIKFGAPPPAPRKTTAPVEQPTDEDTTDAQANREQELTPEAPNDEQEQPDSEEAERARRQAIATRLAGMGGMRFGMLPQTSAPVHPRARSDDSVRTVEQRPPPAAHAQPSAPPSESVGSEDLESDTRSVSDEGVKVEAESEMSLEEINAEDAEEDVEEVPPPVPSRPNRPSPVAPPEAAPPLPGGRRPPVPTSTLPVRPPIPTTESKRSSVPAASRKPSGPLGATSIPQSSDFVMVDELARQEEETPPPPPRRASRPPRGVPPPAPQPPSTSSHGSSSRGMANSQWELPDIPTGSFDLNVGSSLGMDASITSEDSTTYPSAPSPPPVAPPARPANSAPMPLASSGSHTEVQLSADELMQLWGNVGTAVHAAASTLFDKSKKSLIGDGTSHGFVSATLAQVPQASKASYGHLFYSQNAQTVLRRSSNIMPGDIIQLIEAKLKGHKGLQSYHQTAGTVQEPLVGIVSDFDSKKSKVRVFQANQHVGGQTVETTSYRLDDLKSGNVKVFRVASA